MNKKLNKGGGPRSFADKVDGWIDRLDKKLQKDVVVNKALTNNAMEHQKELSETLKQFEDSLKYHHENHEYQKKMRQAVAKMESSQPSVKEITSDKALLQDLSQINEKEEDQSFIRGIPPIIEYSNEEKETEFNFVGQKRAYNRVTVVHNIDEMRSSK